MGGNHAFGPGVFKAIRADEVLTLHRDYFRLGKPLERRIYELGRKHCGRQKSWNVSVEILHKKSGSHGTLEKFRHRVKNILRTTTLCRTTASHSTKRRTLSPSTIAARCGNTPPCPQTKNPCPLFPARLMNKLASKRRVTTCISSRDREWREFWAISGKPKLKQILRRRSWASVASGADAPLSDGKKRPHGMPEPPAPSKS